MANQEKDLINGTNQEGNGKTGKGKFKGFVDMAHRKYDALRYSKAGKWGMRVLTMLTIGATGKYCYDKGKASVTPTVVTIEKIPETEEPAETPAEEEKSATEEV